MYNYPKQRNLVACILLSLFTFGIYWIYWVYAVSEDVKSVSQEDAPSGMFTLLISLITFGIYWLVWSFQTGKRIMYIQEDHHMRASDNSLLYLLLSLFSFSIVTVALVQNDLNKISMERENQQYLPKTGLE